MVLFTYFIKEVCAFSELGSQGVLTPVNSELCGECLLDNRSLEIRLLVKIWIAI